MKPVCSRLAWLSSCLLLLAGCSTNKPAKPPFALEVEAMRAFHNDNARIFWFTPTGKTWSFLAPSKEVRDLAELMTDATTRGVDIVCSGPDAASVRRSIESAFERQTSRLPGLRVLYIGDASEREAIQKIVENHGAGFFYSPGAPKTDAPH